MRKPGALPSATPVAFTSAEARDMGLDANRLRRSDLRAPFHGVRVVAEASRQAEVAALLRGLGDHAVAFGPTAAAFHAMAVPSAQAIDDSTAYVASIRPARAPRGRGVTGVSLSLTELDVQTSGRARVTTRARTWVDLARFLDLPQLVAAADAVCALDADVCSISELDAAVRRAGPVRGVARLRAALDIVDPSSESIAESLLRVALFEGGLPRPVVNPVIRENRRFIARVDMLFAPYGVIVEYEGAHHAGDRRQWRRDLTRIGELQRLGYLVERAHADDLRDPTALIARVRLHLLRRGWTG